MRALFLSGLVAASLAVTGCTSMYHPDYHPVTVTSYEQHVGYPAGGNGAAAGATLDAPPPPVPPPPPPWSAWPSE
jgi:hypothetical protein